MLSFVVSIVARYWAFACAAAVLYMLRERVGAFFVNCLLLTLRVGELIFTTVFFCLRPKLRYIPKGQVKKVAVIGAGASGITAAKEAIEAGMETVVFEQTDKLGGNWLFREEENFGSVYRSTFINTSKQMMMYSDFPMPSHYPTYPHHSQIIEYFTAYCEKFGVMKKIRFNTKVVDVSLNEDGHSWTVVSIRTPSDFIGKPHERFLAEGKKVTEQYDAIVVANGHHSVPRWPDPKFPGQDTFQGHMIHSHAYRDPTSCNKGYDFNHKKTVVVGIGNSAVDIATELSRHGQVYLSQRSGTWVMPKWISGYAFDHLLSPPRWFFEIVPKFMHYTQALAKKQGVDVGGKIEEVQGSMASWGLHPRGKWETMHPTISHDLLHRISTGTIKVCKNIAKIEPKHVTFEDGVRVEADAIIFCTGYNVSFPFLKPSLQPLGKPRGERKIVPKETENKGDDHPENNGIEVYKFMFSPKLPITMAHVGLFQPLGAIMPMSEMQSRWLMQIWTGKKGVATPEDMQKDIDKYREYVTTRYLDRPRHTIQTDGPVFMDELSGFVGCRPNLLNPKNWGCLKELLFAPVAWPVVFRLNGPGAWPGAADALKQAYGQIWARPENETAPELTHSRGKESKTNGSE